ncbi:HAD family hydrolase [Streptomyces spiramenti]|uniref:HAD family hydrolase n=1 Tax=Streptomyces spiramenti TaxID=2720606 RepID=A0ABX1AGS5_9ACTN|nr:HAD family hydrolase [Streptomyces spiramenti]NJP65161.1 HAD family hydrolase [Streptomyces spiramenti]
MPIRAVLWDIDDTLFDYSGAERAGVLRHLAAEGIVLTEPEAGDAVRRWHEVMCLHYARFVQGELTLGEHRRERVRGFLGRVLTDQEADGWYGRYREHFQDEWRIFPDVLPALDAVETAGLRQGLLSNSAAGFQDHKLRRLGIRDRFEVLVCSDDLGCAKPDPDAFHAACMAMNLEPEEVAYVGDRWDTDARAAADAGLTGVWLDRSGTVPTEETAAVARITGLAELLPAIAAPGAPSAAGALPGPPGDTRAGTLQR